MKILLVALWIMVFVSCTNNNVADESSKQKVASELVITKTEIHANALDSLDGLWQGPVKIINSEIHANALDSLGHNPIK